MGLHALQISIKSKLSRPKTNRSIRWGQMRSQLIGQNCPNNEASEVGRNSEKKQNQKQKQQQKQKQKKRGKGIWNWT